VSLCVTCLLPLPVVPLSLQPTCFSVPSSLRLTVLAVSPCVFCACSAFLLCRSVLADLLPSVSHVRSLSLCLPSVRALYCACLFLVRSFCLYSLSLPSFIIFYLLCGGLFRSIFETTAVTEFKTTINSLILQ
jgi:hypothetical protein